MEDIQKAEETLRNLRKALDSIMTEELEHYLSDLETFVENLKNKG